MNCLTKEQILEAAKSSKEIKQALKKLCPDAFEDEEYFNLSALIDGDSIFFFFLSNNAGFPSKFFLNVRGVGRLKNKAFFLTSACNWKLEKDNLGVLCLIPTKKIKLTKGYVAESREI